VGYWAEAARFQGFWAAGLKLWSGYPGQLGADKGRPYGLEQQSGGAGDRKQSQGREISATMMVGAQG
jgi:hypothetical protein